MIDKTSDLSIYRQCELFGVPRSSYYYEPIPETEFNLMLMQEIDKQYMETPWYGSRSMVEHLKFLGYPVGRELVSRLMKAMGIEAMYPKPKKGSGQKQYGKFPYLLKNIEINSQNHVWGTDITYIPVNHGYCFLVAFIDLYSRFVLSWQFSNSLESRFCIEALEKAFEYGRPLIMNSDQGVQYTSYDYINLLQDKNIQISMSGKGRCWDNILVERFWRSLKYEEVYRCQYENPKEACESIKRYIEIYNNKRLHSSLNYRTPAEFYKNA